MNKNVAEKLAELLALISQNPAVIEYQEVEAQIKNDHKLLFLQDSIRQYQRKATWNDYYGQRNFANENDRKADSNRQELLQQPLVLDYQEKLSEANEFLQYITNLLKEKIEQALEEERHDN